MGPWGSGFPTALVFSGTGGPERVFGGFRGYRDRSKFEVHRPEAGVRTWDATDKGHVHSRRSGVELQSSHDQRSTKAQDVRQLHSLTDVSPVDAPRGIETCDLVSQRRGAKPLNPETLAPLVVKSSGAQQDAHAYVRSASASWSARVRSRFCGETRISPKDLWTCSQRVPGRCGCDGFRQLKPGLHTLRTRSVSGPLGTRPLAVLRRGVVASSLSMLYSKPKIS